MCDFEDSHECFDRIKYCYTSKRVREIAFNENLCSSWILTREHVQDAWNALSGSSVICTSG